MVPLDGSQVRQLVDVSQVYTAYRAARREYAARYRGSMSWKSVSGRDYLYRKTETGGAWASLGPRNAETDLIFDRFHQGRSELKARRASLSEQINRMAPVNRAMRLGRVPHIAARILRRLDEHNMLGHGLRVAGTHALYAYEMMAGSFFGIDHVATMDIDLLLDARTTLRFVGTEADAGFMPLLRSIDASFRPTQTGSFRAANDRGFLVDLIVPTTRERAVSPAWRRANAPPDDLTPVEIEGPKWLESSPAVEQIAIDERGFPVLIVAPDPRAFAAHKLWVSHQDDRDPPKRRRDAAQAHAVIEMMATHLPHLSFDDPSLAALPAALRAEGERLATAAAARRNPADWE